MLAFLWLLTSSLSWAVWDLNDISILLPLPKAGEEIHLLRPTTPTRRGALLPRDVYAALPNIAIGYRQEEIYRQHLGVVSLRIDPCFREGVAPEPCQRQIRFVWQPLVRHQNGSWTTVDAAMHTFHVLQENEWQSFVARLKDLQSRFAVTGLPLMVHPVIQYQGLGGSYWRELKQLVTSVCDSRNLTRATVMTVNPSQDVWVFVGVDRTPQGFKNIPIPRIQHFAQGVFGKLDNPDVLRFRIHPAPVGATLFLNLLADSEAAVQSLSAEQLVEAIRPAVQMDNPALHNPGTADCASCHMSRALPQWAVRRFPLWKWDSLFVKDSHRGPGRLSNTTPVPIGSLRAFGYQHQTPVTAQRVINETSAALPLMGP